MNFRKSIALLTLLLFVFSFFFLSLPIYAADENPGEITYVAFTSDVHNMYGNTSANRLENWLNTVSEKLGASFDTMGNCGDLGPGSCYWESDYWTNAKLVIQKTNNNSHVINDGFFICGNHEYNPGNYTHEKNDTTKLYADIGTYRICDNYILYSMGASQSYEQFTDANIANLKSFLNEHKDFPGPIFVLSHYPLHCYNDASGESTENHDGKATKGAGKLISVLNQYHNVIFLWGHNHTSTNSHYDTIYRDILDTAPISFTYAAAGCMSDSEYSKSGLVQGKGLVAAIENDRITLTYYDKSGNVLGTPVEIPMPVTLQFSHITATAQTALLLSFYDENGKMLGLQSVAVDAVTQPVAVPIRYQAMTQAVLFQYNSLNFMPEAPTQTRANTQ